ncbi:MAG TPA: trypsin-like peptidase domain-containing protein [Candidatus Limnocylindrales bacterium]|nr:trypsin-like peptidase domain-containing protein [Candidatus Limnocylindrales bacterium]
MAGLENDIATDAGTRRPWRSRYGRALLAGTIAALLAATAVIFFMWGSLGQPNATPSVRPSPSKSADRLTVAQIYNKLAPSVVSIKATGSGTATGTGVVVNADGAILTAYHVVEGAKTISVTFADGTVAEAEVAGAEPAMDIAVLLPAQLPQVLVPAVLGASRGVGVGDDVVAIGNQLGLTLSTTSGVVSGLDRSIKGDGESPDLKGLIQFDAAVNPGSSGGPLVNARGETIAIVVALANPTDAGTFIGVGFAVPIGQALGAGSSRPPQI